MSHTLHLHFPLPIKQIIMDSKTARSTSLTELLRNRKQIDSDAQLLANRIKLLQQEEQRTMRKIKETRRKAKNVLAARRRDEAHKHFFNQLKLESDRQVSVKHEQIQRFRESLRTVHQQSQESLRKHKTKQVMAVKKMLVDEKEKRQRILQRLREDNYMRARMIQSDRKEALVRVYSQRGQKQAFVREMNLQRFSEEERLIHDREQAVMNMELQEMELIERLKTTQLLQQQANDELESALSIGAKTANRSASLGNSR